MPKLDEHETEVLHAYENGNLESVATKDELTKLRAGARATAIKDRRVNIRLSAGDLQEIQVRALEEGMPYRTLIASVLHMYNTGRLREQPQEAAGDAARAKGAPRRSGRPDANA